MKIVIFSANIGGYDQFNHPTFFDEKVRYILYTDSKDFKSKIWEVNNIDFLDEKMDNARKTRMIKINPHLVLPDHDISIWIDHCFNPKILNAHTFLKKNQIANKNIICFKHDERSCAYEESNVIIKKGLDSTDIVLKQMNKYKTEGFPLNHSLFQCGFIIRKNNSDVQKFNNFWWNEVLNNSHRDQLSQVYSAWKTNIKIDKILFENSIYKNSFLGKKVNHIKG